LIGGDYGNILSFATLNDCILWVDVEDVVTSTPKKLIRACIADNPIVTVSTCEGIVAVATGEEYAFASGGVEGVVTGTTDRNLDFSIEEVEGVVGGVVEDGEGGGAVVFGDDLDTVGGLDGFEAGFGDFVTKGLLKYILN
jgi:hypothetical protein